MTQRRILLVLASLGLVSTVLAFGARYPSNRRMLQPAREAGSRATHDPPTEVAPLVEIAGVVDSIEQVSGGLRPWKVNVRVDRVLRGEYRAPTLEFLVHSPSRRGLVEGKTCTVRAMRTATGYAVDDTRWMSCNEQAPE